MRIGEAREMPGKSLSFVKRIAPALGLFVLAPFCAEYLIGYLPVTGNLAQMFVDLWIFAPLYGGAALLIREIARRSGRGWPTIILLAFAFAVFQAGLVDQSLFNPSYMDIEGWQEGMNSTYIPFLGIGAYNAMTFILGHVIWSICAPIAVVEAFVPDRRTTPWLRSPGLALNVILYTLASALIFWGMLEEEHFLAPAPQLIGAAAVVVISIGLAFLIPRKAKPLVDKPVPSPWVAGAVALVTLSVPTCIEVALGVLGSSSQIVSEWPGIALNLALAGGLAILIWQWSQRKGWSNSHVLALAAGALLTRAWIAFLVEPIAYVPLQDKLIGNAVLFLGAVIVIGLAAWRNRR